MSGLNERRFERIRKAILGRPLIFLLIFLFYIGINVWLNENYVTLPTLFSGYKISFAILFLLFNFILVPGLVATTINLSILRIKESTGLGMGVAGAGTFAGILGGACPGCFVGLFPAFIGIFGLSLTLGNLPLHGLEIQILSCGLLIWAIFLLTEDPVCKIKFRK